MKKRGQIDGASLLWLASYAAGNGEVTAHHILERGFVNYDMEVCFVMNTFMGMHTTACQSSCISSVTAHCTTQAEFAACSASGSASRASHATADQQGQKGGAG